MTTPSHDGFVLSAKRQAAMPESLCFDGVFYQEDVNCSLVVLAFENELRSLGDPLFTLATTDQLLCRFVPLMR